MVKKYSNLSHPDVGQPHGCPRLSTSCGPLRSTGAVKASKRAAQLSPSD
jgi:hypothetical protein